ncbi:unnamed protein product [Brassica oleracea]
MEKDLTSLEEDELPRSLYVQVSTESLAASRCFSNSTERRGTTPMTSLFLLVRSLVVCYAVLRVIPFSSLKLLCEDQGVVTRSPSSYLNRNVGRVMA